jgi:hypothetical protein
VQQETPGLKVKLDHKAQLVPRGLRAQRVQLVQQVRLDRLVQMLFGILLEHMAGALHMQLEM